MAQATLSLNSIKLLEDQLRKMDYFIKLTHGKRADYELINKYLQATGDYSQETLKGETAARLGNKTKLPNQELALSAVYRDMVIASLTGTFLSGQPIFPATASRKHEDAAAQMTALSMRDQHNCGWTAELLRCLEDVVDYNVCGAFVRWDTKRAIAAQTNTVNTASTITGKPNPITYEGNFITRLDPFNTFYDTLCEPKDVHKKGTYAGWHEVVDYIGLKNKYLEWNELYTIKTNIKKIFADGSGAQNYYYTPKIRKLNEATTSKNNWTAFWGNAAPGYMGTNVQGKYEITHMFLRLIPAEFEMTVPNKGNPHVYYLIWVNGHLAYVEPVIAGHNYLPVVFGQLYHGDINTKSFVEYVASMQDLASGLINGSLNSMRRAVGDRALYDPLRVRKADVDSDNPVSKIPVTGNSYERGLDTAYRAIPYVDNVSGNFSSYLNMAIGLTDQITSVNKAGRGNFIKGNKTRFEFDTIMSNSEARIQLGAIRLEGSFFSGIKEILKLNYLVYATAQEIENNLNDTVVKIDPAMLRQVAPEFKMADGLMPSTKIESTEVLAQASQIFANNPELMMEYDVPGMWMSVVKQQGFYDIESYRRTPEQQQKFLNTLAMMRGEQPTQPAEEQPNE